MKNRLAFYKNLTGDTLIAGSMKPEDKDIVIYSLEATSYLIKRGEYITAEEYAKRIEMVHSTDNPRTNSIVTTLKSYKKGSK